MYGLMSCCFVIKVVDCVCYFVVFFFFKQKTAYEMRISDWSSDVCSSDLGRGRTDAAWRRWPRALPPPACGYCLQSLHLVPTMTALENVAIPLELDRKSVV